MQRKERMKKKKKERPRSPVGKEKRASGSPFGPFNPAFNPASLVAFPLLVSAKASLDFGVRASFRAVALQCLFPEHRWAMMLNVVNLPESWSNYCGSWATWACSLIAWSQDLSGLRRRSGTLTDRRYYCERLPSCVYRCTSVRSAKLNHHTTRRRWHITIIFRGLLLKKRTDSCTVRYTW